MPAAGQAIAHVGLPKMEAKHAAENELHSGGCNPVNKSGPVTMDHVLLASQETKEERELRIRGLFNFFDVANVGYLDYTQIEAGLSALQIPAEYKYAKELLKVCDANRDGRVDYQEFRRYMDDKELELYRIFQAIDVEHNGCILPEELWDALVRAEADLPWDFSWFKIVQHYRWERKSDTKGGGFTLSRFDGPFVRARASQGLFSIFRAEAEAVRVALMNGKVIESTLYPVFFSSKPSIKGLNGVENLAGIEIDEEELVRFVEHVDKDNNGIITFEEWRDFLLLYPHEATIENIYQYWERVCLVDIGEQAVIPEGVSKHVHASKYLIAGGVAGATSRTATAPLDRLKVVLQVQTTRSRIMPALKDIWREGGLVGFFRGNGLNVMKVAPESAIRFYTYEMLKNFIANAKGEDKGDIGTSGRLVAGGLAGAVAQTVIYPMDLVKTRLQTYVCEGGKVPKLGALSKDIWVQEGPRAFYRGIIPSLLGIIPYAGIDLAAYETLKDMSKTYILHDSEPGPLVQLGCGTVSGALGATCVYPLQVIRTRLQAQRLNTDTAYKGMSDVFWRTLHHEGIRGFYRGIFPNLLKVVPSASITYLVYESMKKNLDLE